MSKPTVFTRVLRTLADRQAATHNSTVWTPTLADEMADALTEAARQLECFEEVCSQPNEFREWEQPSSPGTIPFPDALNGSDRFTLQVVRMRAGKGELRNDEAALYGMVKRLCVALFDADHRFDSVIEAARTLSEACAGRIPADSSDSILVEGVHILRLETALWLLNSVEA
jgi:hypothetical protein